MDSAAIIESLLAKYAPIDVPGWARQTHGLIITYPEVVEVYRQIAVSKLGRSKLIANDGRARLIPDDFAEHAPVENNTALMKRYSTKVMSITRWRRETGIRPPEHRHLQRPRQGDPVPDGFRQVAPTLTAKALRSHYGVGPNTIQRWLHETGINCLRLKPGRQPMPAITVSRRDMTRAGQAADYLRRVGPVIRCDARGRYTPTGDHWLRGSTLLSGDDVIQRAERNGWRPDAWREIAA